MFEFHTTAFLVIVVYYLVINLIMYIAMAADKSFAIKNKRRIPEKNFYLLAVLGGGFAGLLAMVFKRHKTKHIDFVLVYTVTAILHLLVVYLLMGKFVILFH